MSACVESVPVVNAMYAQLAERVQACRKCVRMENRTRVLGPDNGDLCAAVVFVAEAPGRRGADKGGVPLQGDQTGRNFEQLLCAAGLDRASVFVTNAVLCNPRDEQGCNARPTAREINHCSTHLCDTIALLQPRYVVALGQVALHALQAVAPHDVRLARDVGCRIAWDGRWLVSLYHPGQRARVHRAGPLQEEDFRRLGAMVRGAASAADV